MSDENKKGDSGNNAQKDLNNAQKSKENAFAELEALRAQSAEMLRQNKAREHSLNIQAKQIEANERLIEAAEVEIEALEEKLKTEGALTDKQAERLKDLKESVELKKEENKQNAKHVQMQTKMHDQAKNIASTVLGVNDGWKDTWWGSVVEDGPSGMSARFAELGKSLAEALNPADMLGSVMMKVQTSTILAFIQFDQLSAQMAAATGQGTKYNDVALDVAATNRRFGVGMAEASSAIMGLNESMSGFSDLPAEVTSAMVAQTAQLEKLGVSASVTGGLNDQFMKGMGMTADEAMAVNNELARTAMGLGIPVEKMAGDFQAALPQLAAWGKEAPKIFKKVAAAAKGLGVEMNTLLGFASQFDTFEGAATAVGKLNNILGGDVLNSYDMINASEEERVRMLLQGVQASGKSWDSMDRFSKMAVANAAGITDMAEANKLFSGGLAAYDDAQRKAEANAVSQKELEERTQAAVSVGEKFSQVMEAMAVAVGPLVSAAHSLMNVLLAINDMTGGMLLPVVLLAVGAYALFYQSMKAAIFWGEVQEKVIKKKTVAKISEKIATDSDTISQVQNNTAKTTGIIATLRLAAATAFNTAKTWAAAAASKALALGRAALAAVTNFLGGSMMFLSKSNLAVATTAKPAGKGMAGFFKALGQGFKNPYVIGAAAILAAITLGLGMMAVGVGILTYSLVQLVKAFMEMPGAIIPALAGLTAFLFIILNFIAIVAAMAPIALAFAVSAQLIGLGLLYITPGLIAFSVAAAIFSGAMKLWDESTFATMKTMMWMMPLFGIAMLIASPFMALAAQTMGQATAMLGVAFLALGAGLAVMALSLPIMLPLAAALVVFGLALAYAATPFLVGSVAVGIGSFILGIGLAALGAALLLYTPATALVMALLAPALIVFSFGLLKAAPMMATAALTLGTAALWLGLSLGVLGLALKLFDGEALEHMAILPFALNLFAFGLLFAAPMMAVAAGTLGTAGLILGGSLLAIGIGLKLFDRNAIKAMEKLPLIFIGFALALSVAAPFMAFAAATFGTSALVVGASLLAIGLSLKAFDKKAWKAMEGLTIALVPFALVIGLAGIIMGTSGKSFALSMLFVAPALALLGLAMKTFPEDVSGSMIGLAMGLVPLALAISLAGPLLMKGAIPFALASLILSPALAILGGPLKTFAESMALMAPVAEQMFVLALALAVMGPALAIFAFSMIAVGIAASMPFFSTGIGVFKDAIASMATSFEAIPTEKAKALGDFFSSLAKLTDLNNVAEVMWSIANGIYGVSMALAFMPEEKAFALSEVVNSVTRAAVEVTPEKVENVTGLVEQAATYADVQAKFKAPSVDAFVQALKQVNGDSSSEGGSGAGRGKDIVLELNGRELGRAIDVHLDDKHNLRSN